MNAIILSEEQFKKIETLLENLKLKLETLVPTSRYIDNADFMQLLRISKRTAQAWRDMGLIAYSQVGNKIYYKMADVEAFLKSRKINSVNQYIKK